ncbi:CPBP family intramembrane glutamic endopeptidase [Flavobacterium sp. N1994]|uniref:CPBP family intramembrane glutamic endopeptidase n=1 Tax=Flavobacterium sp. N1994 TaxID=2986827 RepID=UPI0022222C66|nr:CPBP family intramembrane glutamic endopeptidase [Flavobacterium sp. N1994]
MSTQGSKITKFNISPSGIAGITFVILFLLYHAAEYMLLFHNSVVGFLFFQLLFFVAAYFLGNWYSDNGLAAWGLSFKGKLMGSLFFGIFMGVVMYAIPYFISLALGIESIEIVPNLTGIFAMSLPFVFGVLFSSFSEDILTRGLIYKHFKKAIKPKLLILFSATIYVLNHIYRYQDGIETWMYLFLLGVIYIIPVIYTKRLWLTGGMHWAGNCFFYIFHNVIQVKIQATYITPNYLFALCLALFLPIFWALIKAFAPYFKSNSTIWK